MKTARTVSHGTKVRMDYCTRRGDTILRTFVFGSVAGYAKSYGENPSAAVRRASRRGEELVWLSAEAAVLAEWTPAQRAAMKAERDAMPMLAVGDTVRFERKYYRIDPIRGNADHFRLTKI